jgi:hypothetical protein
MKIGIFEFKPATPNQMIAVTAIGLAYCLISMTPDIWGFIAILVMYPFFAFVMGYAFRIRHERTKVQS